MKQRKIPLRMCVVTKERLEKKDLIRIVRTPEKEIIIDLTGKANGKGAYVKKDQEVIKKAMQNKIIDRALEVEVPKSIYEELLNKIEKEGEVKWWMLKNMPKVSIYPLQKC